VTNRHVTPAAAKFYGVGWRLSKQAGKSNPIDAGIGHSASSAMRKRTDLRRWPGRRLIPLPRSPLPGL